ALHGLVFVDRAEPDGGGAELLNVVEPAQQTLQITAVIEAQVGGIEAALQAIRWQTATVIRQIAVVEAVRQQEVDDLILWQALTVFRRRHAIQRERTLPQRQRSERCRPWQTLDPHGRRSYIL